MDRITGHGGLFKTKGVGQRVLAAAINSPISVMETAGEGGAWGMAVLALYLMKRAEENISLPDYLTTEIFAGENGTTVTADDEEIKGFDSFMKSFNAALCIEKAAVEALR